jgi:hypothetical protein
MRWLKKSIKTLPGKCLQFLDFSEQNPTSGPKVKHMVLYEHILISKSTIRKCVNLVDLFITINDYITTEQYLQILHSQNPPKINLPLVQTLEVYNARVNEMQILSKLYTSFDYTFRYSLTDLTLRTLQVRYSDAFDPFGGSYNYISYFPNLKNLYCKCSLYIHDRSLSRDNDLYFTFVNRI